MKKAFNINFQGRVVMMEEDAYENLKNYLQSLRNHFAKEADSEEIIQDIEWRISELFDEIIKNGDACITEAHVESIIKSIGRPQELQQEEELYHASFMHEKKGEDTPPHTAGTSQENTQQPRRLMRDETRKKLGGVCAGIGNYFAIDYSVVRVIAVVLSLFYFAGVIVYIVLWAALPATTTKGIGSAYKKLFRDPAGKNIGGVCSGLAHYFNMEVWVIRLIFLLSLISPGIFGIADIFNDRFGATLASMSLILYIILWIVIPKAKRPTDFLSMKGENIDINSIRSTRNNTANNLHTNSDVNHAKNDTESKVLLQEDSVDNNDIVDQDVPTPTKQPAEQTYMYENKSTSAGHVIRTILKIFLYIILGIILLVLVAALFGFGILCFSAFPYMNYFYEGNWQNTAALIAMLCGIWLPIIVILVWLIRKIIGYRHKTPRLSTICLVLWLAGVACAIALIVNGFQQVRYQRDLPAEKIMLNNSAVNTLVVDFVSSVNKRSKLKNFRLIPFSNSPVYIDNIELDIDKSADSNYHVYLQKSAYGHSPQEAQKYAGKIVVPIQQQDSVLHIQKGMLINAAHKFRNQKAFVTVEVPVGKKLFIQDNYNNLVNVEIENVFTHRRRNWRTGTTYIMTKDGLKQTDDSADENEDTFTLDDNDEQVKKETINNITKYYFDDEEIDSIVYEKILEKMRGIKARQGK